jgi:hypothetical protein
LRENDWADLWLELLGNEEKNRSCTARKEVPVYADITGILGVL